MPPTNREHADRRATIQAARRNSGDGLTRRNEACDPSRGGRGYDSWFRAKTLANLGAGLPTLAGGPHRKTVRRWQNALAMTGSVNPDPAAGGAPRNASPLDVLIVHTLQALYPTMTNFEMRNVIATHTQRVWTDIDLVRMRKDYNPNATTSRQRVLSHATEHNPITRQMWRSQPPPYGHQGVGIMKLIDADEMGVYITHTQRGFGYALVGRRPTEVQIHEKDKLFTVVMGISAQGECFYQIIRGGGVNGQRFVRFLTDFLFPHCGNDRVLMWDNLGSHLTPAVDAVIGAANGGTISSLARPAYTPHWAPIEFIFGIIEAPLRRYQYQATRQNFEQLLRRAIREAVTPVTCYNIFKHCGY
jgi:transposase